MPNILTGCRVVCGLLLLFFPAYSTAFYVLCAIGGGSDILDGAIARKFKLATPMGAKLDTIADWVFLCAVLIKVVKAMGILGWLMVWAGIIALIKLINLASGWILYRRFVPEHTKMNKATGVLVFATLFCAGILPWQGASILAALTCALATFAAIQEGHYIRTGKEIN